MPPIPLWKIKREAGRLGRNSIEIGHELIRKFYFRRHYDRVTRKALHRTAGALPLGRELAIYVIFPTAGLLESHLMMLRSLRQAGISTLVVSNHPLDTEARARLCQEASLLIERPNIGYDFGGYRDGILEISDSLHELDRLWLLNDSAWLLPQGGGWFTQARQMNKDFVAATSSFPVWRRSWLRPKRVLAASYRTLIWNHRTDHAGFHYASYALCITSSILRDRSFLRYWQQLDIRNDKKRTVRRGEIGLTQWVRRHGYSHGATHEVTTLDQELARLRHSTLDAVARDIIVLNDPELAQIKKNVLATPQSSAVGRAERIGFILTAVARHGTAYALAIDNLRRHHVPFLKKSPVWLSSEGPDAMLAILRELDERHGTTLLQEARAYLAQHPDQTG